MQLVETYTDADFQIVEDTHGRPLRVRGEFQLANVRNANGRIYSEALWKRVLNLPETQSRLKNRRMVGELDHPSLGKTSVRNISHLMTELSMGESKRLPGVIAVYGTYETAPTPDGKILENLHRARYGVAVSSRGDGDLEERGDGASWVSENSYKLDTWDCVMDPSVNTSSEVIESIDTSKLSCTCKIPNKSVENLVHAIYGIVESGDFDKSAALYYKQILESVNPDHSETYLLATQALSELKKHLEVPKVSTSPVALSEARPTSTLTEQQIRDMIQENASLKTQLETAHKRADAGERLVSELMIQSRNFKMRCESMVAKLREHDALESRYNSARDLIGKMREAISQLQGEGKLRQAAERLLGALLSKIDESKRSAYVDKMLSNPRFTVESRKTLRPVLLECQTKSDVNKILISVNKSVTESRQTRGLPPLNENGRRSTRIPSTSPLLESGDARNDQPTKSTPAPTPKLQEQVDFTKALLRVTKQNQQPMVP